MDISSLLSPQDSPKSPARRPPGPAKRTSSMLSSASRSAAPQLPHSVLVHAQQMHSPSVTTTSTSSSGRMFQPSAQSTPTPGTEIRRSPMSVESLVTPQATHYSRQGSTSGMDTLAGECWTSRFQNIAYNANADLASMQQHQQTSRPSVSAIRSTDFFAPSRSPSLATIPNTQRTYSVSRASVAMTDAPAKTPPVRVYTAMSMSQSDLQTVTELVSYLSENSYVYDYHVRLIRLLHQGFMAHVFAGGSPEPVNNPHDFELLGDLRQAREAMDSRFPVGEELWVDWIKCECLLARTTEDRVAVMELCRRAVADEVASVAIWRLYGDWVWSLYCTAFGISGPSPETSTVSMLGAWSEEDRLMGMEIFAKDAALQAWTQAVAATTMRLSDSNVVWDRYIEILTFDGASYPQKHAQVQVLFETRLKTPHSTWEHTFSMFSTFISNQYQDERIYEDTMVAANQAAAPAKQQYAIREAYELRLQTARERGDGNIEWAAYTDYLDFELSQSRKRNTANLQLLIALYERTALRFPTYASLWEDYVDLLLETQEPSLSPAALAQRAVRHCPWSGDLWSQLLVITEASRTDFQAMEAIKHKATKTGLLDVGGLDELIKVYSAWCGFLRRRAFQATATEDELDIAEVGILSAIEDVKKCGEKTYGKSYKGDPLYRMERTLIKFLSQLGRNDEARSKWRELIPQLGDSYEFWYRFYVWEMMIAQQTHSSHSPQNATAVLRQAIRRPNLDWPEKTIEIFLHHCQQNETIQEVQNAIVQARKASKAVTKRRDREAAEAAAVAQLEQKEQRERYPPEPGEESPRGGKRKRDLDAHDEIESTLKRSRPDESNALPVLAHNGDVGASNTSQIKRDRENTTVRVNNLPPDATETRVRQYFRDCGTILTVNLVSEEHSSTAIIEFEGREDVLSAETRNMKSFDGHEIDVHVGTGTTVWVTNFPPTADEDFIRNLFKQYGEIIDIRFPSLKFNTHRRFCYVQFLTSSQANAATQLHETVLPGGFKLQVKISDPSQKKDRTGPMYDNREIYVGNVHWQASEDDVRDLFKAFGSVESVRIPRNVAGKSKGAAFVVFRTKDDAEAALAMNMKDFKGRVLTVTLTKPNATGKRQTTQILTSASPEAEARSQASGSTLQEKSAATNHKERTVVLLDVPDTVNDSRIRAFMEPYGSLRKIVLRPDRQGAVVEYENVANAGKAAMAVDGKEITQGQKIRVGTLEDAKAHERKKNVFGSALVSRPGQPAPRRGGRGGLGAKRAGIGFGGPRADTDETGKEAEEKAGDAPSGGKSNADFKAMFLKS